MDADQKKKLLREKLQQAGFKKNIVSKEQSEVISQQQIQQVSLNPYEEGLASLLIWKFLLPKNIDIQKLHKAFDLIIQKYPILSTTYDIQNNQFNPVRTDQLDWKYLYNNLQLDIQDPIDLQIQVPLKIRLVDTSNYIELFIVLHHVAADEVSWQILLKEITYFYNDVHAKVDVNTRQSIVQPSISRRMVEESTKFWANQLKPYLNHRVDLFAIYRNKGFREIGYESDLLSIPISKNIIKGLKQKAKKNKTSVISLLIASVAILLKNRGLSGCNMIGTAADQRESDESQQTIGNFISLLPLLVNFSGYVDLIETATKIHTQISESFRYRFLSIENLVNILKLMNNGKRHPLLDFIVLHRDAQRIMELDGEQYCGEHVPSHYSLFDLVFSLDESQFLLLIEFKKNLLPTKIVETLLQDWSVLLMQEFSDSVSKNIQEKLPQLKLGTTDIVTKIQSLVEENPDICAVEFLETQLTRGELWKAVQNLVIVLKQQEVQAGDVIAIAVDRFLGIPVLLLAILYVGAIFLPIDSSQPQKRINSFLKKAKPKLLISNHREFFTVMESDDYHCQYLYLDLATLTINNTYHLLAKPSSSLIQPPINITETAQIPAYLIFTSGTTGEPKGVVISRQSLNAVILAMQQIFVQPKDSQAYLSLSTLGFDISIFEILAPLFYGIKLLIGESSWLKDPLYLSVKLTELKPTIVEATPSLWSEILQVNSQSVKNIRACCGGENLPPRVSDQLIKNGADVYNLYGPTEVTIISTFGHCESNKIPSIGHSLDSVHAVVLDENLNIVPDGFMGELYLFGPQLAIGYLDKSDLTANYFIANPFVKGERIYRTGDLAYKDVNTGEIFYCGRTDNQLSLHGVRVEIEEIEQVLTEIDGVENAVVKVEHDNQLLIHAFYVGEIDELTVKEKIKELLPNYLQPLSFNKINKIPVNYNGKIDRNALPEPVVTQSNARLPETKYEKIVAKVLQIVLGIEKNLMATDNFFALGGYSLQIARLIHLIQKETGVKLFTKDIFDHSTLEEIALLIEKKSGVGPEDIHVSFDNNQIIENTFELSYGQKRILAAESMSHITGLYNMPLVFKISGDMNKNWLRQAFLLIFKKHPILTSVYDVATFTGRILSWQEVEEKWAQQFEIIQCQDKEQIKTIFDEKIHTSFDLNQELPIRVVSCQQETNDYLLILIHHVVADEWSLALILGELKDFYNQLKNKHDVGAIVPTSNSYFNLTKQLNNFSHEAKQFWAHAMSGFETMSMPFLNTEVIRQDKQPSNFDMWHQEIVLDTKEIIRIKQLEQQYKISPFHFIQACVFNILARFVKEDVCIGIPVHGRNDPQLEEVIGYFSNTLPIRIHCSWDMTGEELLLKVREVTLNAISHSDFPLEMIYSGSEIPFSVLVDYRNGALPSFETDDFKAQVLNWDIRLAKFPIIILYSIVDNKHTIDLLLSSEFYQDKDAILFKQTLIKSIQFFLKNIDKNIASVNYACSENENKKPTYFCNSSKEFRFLGNMLEEALKNNSHKIAISGIGYSMEYATLLKVIQYISYQIKTSSFDNSTEQVFAIVAGNRLEQLVLMLSVLYSGKAYVVLDLEYPLERRKKILNETKPISYLTSIDLYQEWGQLELNVIQVDLLKIIHEKEVCGIASSVPTHPLSLAYIIFTSGSTGEPKGVLISHRGLSDLLFWFRDILSNQQDIRMLSLAPMTFDVGLIESLVVILQGGHLKFVEDHNRAGQGLLNEVQQHNITNLSVTPSILETIGDPKLLSGDIVISTGAEAISARLFNEWAKNHVMINLYGPTEVTVNALTYLTPKSTHCEIVPIGLPDYGMSAIVLDEALQPTPIGVKGELYLGGTGLARGYLNNMEETAVKFIASPFLELGSRLYRTGDLVSVNQDGLIISHGRADEQFKIRGLRVEPAEIEGALLSLEEVNSAWVGVNKNYQKTVLLAAVTIKGNQQYLDMTAKYRDKLAELLPQYLIPQKIIAIPVLPITANGKIDKSVIFAADTRIKKTQQLDLLELNGFANSLLELIRQASAEVLGNPIHEIYPQANFLEIGGDSISALQVVGILKKQGIAISPRELFDAKSFIELAEIINKKSGNNVTTLNEKDIDLEADEGVGLFKPISMVQEHLMDSPVDNLFAYSLLVNAPSDIEARVAEIFKQLIDRHTSLRTKYISVNEAVTLPKNHPNLLPQIFIFDQEFCTLAFCKEQLGRYLSPINGKNLAIGVLQNGLEYRLLMVIHHLAVDIVSWNIILSDLKKIYKKQVINSMPYSLKYCSELVHSTSYDRQIQSSHSMVYHKTGLFDKKFDPKQDVSSLADSQSLILSESTTEKILLLLSKLKNDINAEISIEHLFLCVLARAIGKIDFLGAKLVSIDLETHGRNQPELLNTVGWFTWIKTISCPVGVGLVEEIKHIIQIDKSAVHSTTSHQKRSEILLNYLGLLGDSTSKFSKQEDLFNIVSIPEAVSMLYSDCLPLRNPMTVSVSLVKHQSKEQFKLDFIWSSRLSSVNKIKKFIQFVNIEIEKLGSSYIFQKKTLPVTYTQEGILQLYENNAPGKEAYVIKMRLFFTGQLNFEKLVKAWEKVLIKHPMLSASFHKNKNHYYAKFNRACFDWSHRNYQNQINHQLAFEDFLLEEESKMNNEFILEKGPLFRVKMLSKNVQEHVLILYLHHILADGWSSPIILKDLFDAYQDKVLTEGSNIVQLLEILRNIPKEHARYQWKKYLRGVKATILADQGIDRGSRQEIKWQLGDQKLMHLSSLCRKNKITVGSLLHIAWARVLIEITQQKKISFGSVTSGRPTHIQGIDQAVGLFSNTIPICIDGYENDIAKLSRETSNILMLASEEPISLSELLAISGHDQLFDTLLVLENYPLDLAQLLNPAQGIKLSKYEYEDGSHYPISIIFNIQDKIQVRLLYADEIDFGFSVVDIPDIFNQQLDNLLIWLTRGFENKFSFNQPVFDQLRGIKLTGKTIANDLLILNPNETDSYINLLTRRLIELGCYAEKRIILSLPKTIETTLLSIAIWKTGACLVPLDSEIENSRYLQIKKAIDPHLVIDINSLEKLGLLIDYTRKIDDIPEFSLDERLVPIDLTNSCYIIHTSGTTGIPKGVNMQWSSIDNLIKWQFSNSGIDQSKTISQFSPNYFDVSVQELLTAFALGHSMVVIPEDIRNNSLELAKYLEDNRVDVLFSTNLVINELASVYEQKKIPNLEYLIQAGEKLEVTRTLKRWVESDFGPQLSNHYGPTETHVVVATSTIDTLSKKAIPIGVPITNNNLLILDEFLKEVPQGQSGELYVLGDSLAMGYVDNTLGTCVRFLAVPRDIAGVREGSRMYRTGDLVYQDSDDGQYYCLGRVDEQIKIKGVRVEPNEIIRALCSIKGILTAHVIPNKEKNATTLMAAVILDNSVITEENINISEASIRQTITNLLPTYLLPDILKIVTDVPLTPNNKLDVRKLREQLLNQNQSGHVFSKKLKHYDFKLDLIKTIINGVLQRNQIIFDQDDFFAIGGHSLLATKLATQLNELFNTNLSLKDVFELRTPLKILAFIEEQENKFINNIQWIRPKDRARATSAQKRFWVLSKIMSIGHTYHLPLTVKLTEHKQYSQSVELLTVLKKTAIQLIAKHEALRTVIRTDDKGPYQYVLPAVEIESKLIAVYKEINAKQLNNVVYAFHRRLFNLEEDLMFRFSLFRIIHSEKNDLEQEYILAITIHHVSCDAWSIPIILNDIRSIFENLLLNPVYQESQKVSNYIDVIGRREAYWKENSVVENDLQYWQQQLRDLPYPMNLPLDFKRPMEASFKGRVYEVDFEKSIAQQIICFSRDNYVTPFMFLQACIILLLHKMGCGDDIVVGTPDSGRQGISDPNVVGCFINLLVLRFNLAGNPTFMELLSHVRKVSLEAYSHSSTPFDLLVKEFSFSGIKDMHPLFTVGVGLQNYNDFDLKLSDFKVERIEYQSGVSRYDLNFDVVMDMANSQFKLVVEYNTDLFRKKTVKALVDRLGMIIEVALASQFSHLSEFSILLSHERKKFYRKIEQRNRTLSHKISPEYLNIVHGIISDDGAQISDCSNSIRYNDFQNRVEILAKKLISTGVKPGDCVSIQCSRSLAFFIGVLSVLRVGATYVPVADDIPVLRFKNIIKQTKSKLILGDLPSSFELVNVDHVGIDSLGQLPPVASEGLSDNVKLPDISEFSLDLGAYVIFTSGTTGEPKGIVVNRRSLAASLDSTNRVVSYSKDTCYLATNGFGFDLAVFDVLWPLSNGLEVYIISREQRFNPELLKTVFKQKPSTMALSTPSFWSIFTSVFDDISDDKPLAGLTVLSAGEYLTQSLATKLLNDGAEVRPAYGPAETVIISNIDLYKGEGVPTLGNDFDSVQTFLLDDYLQPVPEGVCAGIYIAGSQLADGYLQQSGLSSIRFVANPFYQGRLYRTGDFAVRNNGQLLFSSREDDQVSIRGHRVELAEVVSTILSIDMVINAAVKVLNRGESSILVGYVVLKNQPNPSVQLNQIKQIVSQKLPDYMVPQIIQKVDFIPLTSNSKVDYKKLPDPCEFASGQKVVTETEKVIAQTLMKVLQISEPSRDAGFIELGLDSISIILFSNQLRKLGYHCSPQVIFTNQTIVNLAQVLDSSADTDLKIDGIAKEVPTIQNIKQDDLKSALEKWQSKQKLGGHSKNE